MSTAIPPTTDCIEAMALDFLTQMNQSTAFTDDAKHISKSSRPKIQIQLKDRTKDLHHTRTITYPRKTSHGSGRSFGLLFPSIGRATLQFDPTARIFQILDLAHQAVLDDVPMTKRDLYYHNPVLFGTQSTVDKLVDDLSATFGLERSALNIRASSKGLVCGSSLSIHLTSGDSISCNDAEGSLIPVRETIRSIQLRQPVEWILLVEKDAIFQTLSHHGICSHPSMPGPGLMITGKGYPDVATRHLVTMLEKTLPKSVPIMALVDGDPFGLDILSVYKFGSRAMQSDSLNLTTIRIQWLGLLSSELSRFGVHPDSLIPISAHDERKALSMLQRPTERMPSTWKKELMRILHTRRKAELEILSFSNSLVANTQDTVDPSLPGSNSKGLLLPYIIHKTREIVLYDQSLEVST